MDATADICFVDGSFSNTGNVGYSGAVVVWKEGEQLIQYVKRHFDAISPLHAELKVILLAIKLFQDACKERGIIVTDCQQLSESFSMKNPPMHLN
jgi:ribonuclease HI